MEKRRASADAVANKHRHLEAIVELLAKHAQRATYGAVGGVVGLPARSLMSGRPRSRANSFVVAASTGKPTGYAPTEYDPALESRAEIIATPESLTRWLRTRG
ncbi:MAG TPA: hypothetical protein VFS55_17110 [Dokdonella sp.]|nr:hypothetical protein [Dokdonella sp.]